MQAMDCRHPFGVIGLLGQQVSRATEPMQGHACYVADDLAAAPEWSKG